MKRRKVDRPRTMAEFLTSSASEHSNNSSSSSQTSRLRHLSPAPPPQPPPPLAPSSPEVEVATAPITRGHSKGISEWNTGVKIDIKFDSSFQPVGERATQLKSQLGQIVRDGHRIPLTIIDWKAVGNDVKEGIWTEVKKNLVNVPEGYKFVCLRCCNTLWKDHKSKTKANYFEKRRSDPNLISDVPPHIVTEQWAELVTYWSSEEAKMIATRNSINREQRGPVHNTGRKHFSQLRYEMEQNGEETDKMSLWMKSRDHSMPEVAQTIKEYTQRLSLEPEDQQNLTAVKDKIFHDLIGDDGHGYCRTYGSGVPRCLVYPQQSFFSQNTDELIQKITDSVSKVIQDQIAALHTRINMLENKQGKDTDSHRQVPDATSGYDIRMESVGEEVTPASASNQETGNNAPKTSNAPNLRRSMNVAAKKTSGKNMQ